MIKLASLALCHAVLSFSNFQALAAVTNTSKAGLAWPNGNYVDIKQFLSTEKVSWYYTWGPWPIEADIEFVPMLWGSDQVSQFNSSIDGTVSKQHVTAVLGMNEPQQSTQSNLTPSQGAEIWTQYIQPLHGKGLRLGTPAPTSAPDGKTWIQEFMSLCANCTIDFVALHWYDVNATAFQEYIEDFYNTFHLPIWVTEWACQNFNNVDDQCSYEDIQQFLAQTQSFMDNASYVERYAWFGAMENLQGVNPDDALMTSSGKINELGVQYIGGNATVILSGISSVRLDPTCNLRTLQFTVIFTVVTSLLLYFA